jgi:hypothetical protein
LPAPQRQVLVVNRHGDFVAFVDLAWPELGVFIEPVSTARQLAEVIEQARCRPLKTA